ncbi:MAG: hypothetical protein JSV16_03080 [Candidatus Hydrogenedentota bacterium]|nr:MAG: hypothetical protein JSV16_03080 [Candidatus Hydrogenedentota bacterium]
MPVFVVHLRSSISQLIIRGIWLFFMIALTASGATAGWGGLPRTAAFYILSSVEKNDGKTAHAVTVKDVVGGMNPPRKRRLPAGKNVPNCYINQFGDPAKAEGILTVCMKSQFFRIR